MLKKYFIALSIKSSFILKNFNSYKIYALRKVNDPWRLVNIFQQLIRWKIQQIKKRKEKKMILRSFLLLLSTGSIQAQAQTDDRPNIIFVITDDLGWSDVSWNNIQTNSTPFMADLIHSGQASSLRNSYATHRIGFYIFTNQFGSKFSFKMVQNATLEPKLRPWVGSNHQPFD